MLDNKDSVAFRTSIQQYVLDVVLQHFLPGNHRLANQLFGKPPALIEQSQIVIAWLYDSRHSIPYFLLSLFYPQNALTLALHSSPPLLPARPGQVILLFHTCRA